VHLDGDPHVGLGGERLDLGPERDRHLVPLVVQRLLVDAVPRDDRPRGLGAAGLGRGETGHGDDRPDAEETGQCDRPLQVLPVRDLRIRVQGVAVAVERGERDAVALERGEVLLTCLLAGEELLDRQMRCPDEPARVHLHAGQVQVAQDLQSLLEGLVVQAGGVGAEQHVALSLPRPSVSVRPGPAACRAGTA
jgi:hypothetical protein